MRTLITAVVGTALGAALVLAADAAAGKATYDKSCKSCHGADGTPNAAIAKGLKVEMKALGSKEVQAKSDAEIKKEILEGVGKMKGYKIANPDDVVAHVRSLKK
jgi:mono/diheme cytochrome c family protein